MRDVDAEPDPERDTRWVLALYGATMMSVQNLEAAVALVYLLANHKPSQTQRPAKRQLINSFRQSWAAFQTGTARMKLNDSVRGIKDHLDPDLYEEVDQFLAGPRAQLVHRFLIERLETPDAAQLRTATEPLTHIRFRRGTVLELLEATLVCERLTRALFARVDELRASLADAPEVPDELREFVEQLARAVMFKEFPKPLNPPAPT
jgi:hypothetical protein